MGEKYHEPVMLNEVIEWFDPNPGKRYIDATLGDGGHSKELLKHGSTVLGIDISKLSIQQATKRLIDEDKLDLFAASLGNFKDISVIANKHGFGKVSGILFDLGYSSSQLETEEVGLAFSKDQPLDMRLDSRLGVTAADLVNALNESQLAQMFFNLSDEKLSRRFARAIVSARNLKKIQTTQQLAEIVKSAAPSGYEHGRIHPATRVFQALRIAVNDEFENLKIALPQAARLLLPGGRMIIISFHSLEDKLVKDFGRSVQPELKILTRKPVVPTESEVSLNPRARSAKMRVFEKAL